MSNALLLWLIVGTVLIVAELTTGTFYLLVFGAAAWVGAAAAYFDFGLAGQLAAAGAAAAIGLAILVPYDMRRRANLDTVKDDADIGNDVTVESATAGKLRVSYRGSTWDAEADAGTAPMPGSVCTIIAVRGNTLVVRPRV